MNRNSLLALAVLQCVLLSTAALAGDKPTILGPVLNGASMSGFEPSASGPAPLGSGLAGGSIFVVFGLGLGPAELVQGAVPYPQQLPPGTGGTRIMFRSLVNEEIYSAYLIHSWQNQVSGIVPSQLPVGLAEVTLSYDGMESDPTVVGIVSTSPALFTVSQSGQGAAVVQNYESVVSQPLNALTRPASPGQHIILWGTGLGPIDGPDNVSPAPANLRDDISVRFSTDSGFVDVPADYAGRSPEFPGVDQINVRVPDDGSIELGCYQSLGLQIGNHGFGSAGAISISDTPGQCDHPWGLAPEKLAELDAGGTANFLHLTFSRGFTHATAAKVEAVGVPRNASVFRALGARNPFINNLAFGGGGSACLQATSFAAPTPPSLPSSVLQPVRRIPFGHFSLELGDSLTLMGPGARTVTLAKFDTDSIEFGPLPDLGGDTLVPGDWTLSTPGGSDAPAFQTSFSVVPLPEDVVPESVSIGSDLEIVWDGAAYDDGDGIEIQLQLDADEQPPSGTKVILCGADAMDGSILIQAQDFAWLEAPVGSQLQWQISLAGPPQEFTADGLDHGQIGSVASVEQYSTTVE